MITRQPTAVGKSLTLRRGTVRFPAYIPVTTFGDKYPLDRLVRPYLPRLAQAAMVSLPYAKQITDPEEEVALPLWVDSGGFASLLGGSRVLTENQLGILEVTRSGTTEWIHPRDVLELQERLADVAFTLDFPIPPGMNRREAKQRQKLTIANALWAVSHRRRADLPLYACVQGWDADSYRVCAREVHRAGFDGFAIGGLVPRMRDVENVLAIVAAVRAEIGTEKPLHVFGLGNPEIVERLFAAGVDSVDSSGYLKAAADGRLWTQPGEMLVDATVSDRLHLALHNLAFATQSQTPLSVNTMPVAFLRQSELA